VGEVRTKPKYSDVKEYYQTTLSSDGKSQTLVKYRKIIGNEFFPSRGFGKLRLSVIKKAIGDFKKVSDSIDGLVELMLYYVEQGIDFVESYGDIKEDFYGSMVSHYEQAVKLIVKHNLQSSFYIRCQRIVKDSCDFGYGFGDDIEYIFTEILDTP
jgi:hypothetical protein